MVKEFNTLRTMDDVRRERDRRLAESDWTQISDTPLTGGAKAAWVQYRQALRGLPNGATDPSEIVWPVKP